MHTNATAFCNGGRDDDDISYIFECFEIVNMYFFLQGLKLVFTYWYWYFALRGESMVLENCFFVQKTLVFYTLILVLVFTSVLVLFLVIYSYFILIHTSVDPVNVLKAKSIAEERTERLRGYCPFCTSESCVRYMKEDGLCLPESQ